MKSIVFIGRSIVRRAKGGESEQCTRDKRIRFQDVRAHLEPFFDKSYYLNSYPDVAEDGVDPLDHYIKWGWREGRNPNAEFSTTTYLKTYPHLLSADINPLLHYIRSKNSPAGELSENDASQCSVRLREDPVETPMAWLRQVFDEQFYLAATGGLPKGTLAFDHFLSEGMREGRAPHPNLVLLARAARMRAAFSAEPFSEILRLFPRQGWKLLLESWFWERFARVVELEFYSRQTKRMIRADRETALADYLAYGAFEGLRITPFFNRNWYLQALAKFQAQQNHSVGAVPVPGIEKGGDPFCHFMTLGWQHRIVPTPLFDEQFYRDSHGDLRTHRPWIFEHFIFRGHREAWRKPSPFLPERPASAKPLSIVDWIISKDGSSVRDCAASGNPISNLADCSTLEQTVLAAMHARNQMETGIYAEMVRKAAAIEPLIVRPYGHRKIQHPFIRHDASELVAAGERIRERLVVKDPRTIVIIPHCRMSGAARVAGNLVKALIDIEPDKTILLVTTESSEFEYPEWFPDGISILDFSSMCAGFDKNRKVKLLVDLIRGVCPDKVINVNSKLCWDMYLKFGQQLSGELKLYAYLFTWDIDENGNKGGYPITYMPYCFAFLSGVFVDNCALWEELVQRYAMSHALRQKLHWLRTPYDSKITLDCSRNMLNRKQQRNNGAILTAMWAGRLDRQKRFDIVIELAKRAPDLRIRAWGKEVLGKGGFDATELPPNIMMEGTYSHFLELPLNDIDFFLYTAEWDGMPTILIDAGSCGMATVSCVVGGIADLVSFNTAVPVDNALSAHAYLDAIRWLESHPDEVCRRAAAMRRTTRRKYSEAAYRKLLKKALGGDLAASGLKIRTQGLRSTCGSNSHG